MDDWLTLDDARTRLGLHPDTLRRQVRRGQREGHKDNLGRWLVRVGPDELGRIDPGVRADGPDASARTDPDRARAHPDESGRLREQVVRLEERLVAAEGIRAAFAERVAELRADLERERRRAEAAEARQAEQDRRLDEVLRRLGELAAERPERRSWQGLWPVLRRFWRGEGRDER